MSLVRSSSAVGIVGTITMLVLGAGCRRASTAVYEFQGSLAESSHFSVDVANLDVTTSSQRQHSGSPLIKASNGTELWMLAAERSNKAAWRILDETFRASLERAGSRVTSEGGDIFVVHKLTISNPKLASTEISAKRWNRQTGDHYSMSLWSPVTLADTAEIEERLVRSLKSAKCLP